MQGLIEEFSNVSIRAPALSSSNAKSTCSFMLPLVDPKTFTFHRSGKSGDGLGSEVSTGHARYVIKKRKGKEEECEQGTMDTPPGKQTVE